MLSIDVSNAFGSIAHSAVWRAFAESAPCLVPYLSSAWQGGASMELYVKGPSGLETSRCMAGVSQGSPLAPYLYEIAQQFGLSGKMHTACCPEIQARPRLLGSQVRYVDDITLWGTHAQLEHDWQVLPHLLADVGLELKAPKCQLWRIQAPGRHFTSVIPLPSSSQTEVLGGTLLEDEAFLLGRPTKQQH